MTQQDSVFDSEAFLDANTTDTEGSTTLLPIPPGTYNAIISEVKARPWSSEKGSGMSLDISYEIVDDGGKIEQEIGRKPVVTQGYFLDLKDGKMDFSAGKNVQLNRVRDAVGQNVPGQAWKATNMKGQALQIVVTNSPDKNNSDVIYSRVKSVGRLV